MFISRLLVFTINKDINSFSFFWVFFWQDSIVGTLFDNNSTFFRISNQLKRLFKKCHYISRFRNIIMIKDPFLYILYKKKSLPT